MEANKVTSSHKPPSNGGMAKEEQRNKTIKTTMATADEGLD